MFLNYSRARVYEKGLNRKLICVIYDKKRSKDKAR